MGTFAGSRLPVILPSGGISAEEAVCDDYLRATPQVLSKPTLRPRLLAYANAVRHAAIAGHSRDIVAMVSAEDSEGLRSQAGAGNRVVVWPYRIK
jgi:hypothetical protein